ncbi:MAG: FecR domain-containing protein [Bacteroidales bacterium]|nr:FecR domain-containing protein [Bacteroidales bacterium]
MINEVNEIIARVLSGEDTAGDRQALLGWFRESADNPEKFAQCEMLWNALEIIGQKHAFDADEGYQHFLEHIKETGKPVKSVSLFGRFLRIAAMFILVAGAAFLSGYFLSPSGKPDTANCIIVAPKGNKAFAELPDGTRVWLNAESKLTYPGTFSDDSRHVYLEGESYFEVAKDSKRPFIVHTSAVNIRAIGTAFNVKSYPSENIIQTTLVEGSVAIERQPARQEKEARTKDLVVYLKPNEQATFYKETSVIDVASKTSVVNKENLQLISRKKEYTLVKKESVLLDKKVDTELFTSWKENKLTFDNEPFESLVTKLERRYNMQFNFIDDELKSFRFTGKFPEISVEQLLAALQYASPFYYVIDDTLIYISLEPIHKRNMHN